MKLVRDFETLTRPKKILVGIVSTIIGAWLSIVIQMSFGFTLEEAISQVSLMIVVSLFISVAFGIAMRLRANRPRQLWK